MEPIKRETKTSVKILLFGSLVFMTLLIIIAGFTLRGWSGWVVKAWALLVVAMDLFIGYGFIKGVLPPSLVVDEKGITCQDFRSTTVAWSAITYISDRSRLNQRQAEILAELSERQLREMDGQELEELESQAEQKDRPGVYIGYDNGEEELILSRFFKTREFEAVCLQIKERRCFYSRDKNGIFGGL